MDCGPVVCAAIHTDVIVQILCVGLIGTVIPDDFFVFVSRQDSILWIWIWVFHPAIRSYQFNNHRLPYNWKTPITYLFTMAIQFAATFYLGAIIVCFILFFGICEFLIAFGKDLGHQLDCVEVNVLRDVRRLKTRNYLIKERVELKRHLCETLHFHSKVLQLRFSYLFPFKMSILYCELVSFMWFSIHSFVDWLKNVQTIFKE